MFDSHGSTIKRMEEGFKFFVDWADEQRSEDDPKKFLAWQVYVHACILHVSLIIMYMYL